MSEVILDDKLGTPVHDVPDRGLRDHGVHSSTRRRRQGCRRQANGNTCEQCGGDCACKNRSPGSPVSAQQQLEHFFQQLKQEYGFVGVRIKLTDLDTGESIEQSVGGIEFVGECYKLDQCDGRRDRISAGCCQQCESDQCVRSAVQS